MEDLGDALQEEKNNIQFGVTSHYNQYQGFEVIDVCEQLRAPDGSGGFNRGNAFKYLARAGWKSSAKHVEDLEKAKNYIQREIDRVKAELIEKDVCYDSGRIEKIRIGVDYSDDRTPEFSVTTEAVDNSLNLASEMMQNMRETLERDIIAFRENLLRDSQSFKDVALTALTDMQGRTPVLNECPPLAPGEACPRCTPKDSGRKKSFHVTNTDEIPSASELLRIKAPIWNPKVGWCCPWCGRGLEFDLDAEVFGCSDGCKYAYYMSTRDFQAGEKNEPTRIMNDPSKSVAVSNHPDPVWSTFTNVWRCPYCEEALRYHMGRGMFYCQGICDYTYFMSAVDYKAGGDSTTQNNKLGLRCAMRTCDALLVEVDKTPGTYDCPEGHGRMYLKMKALEKNTENAG